MDLDRFKAAVQGSVTPTAKSLWLVFRGAELAVVRQSLDVRLPTGAQSPIPGAELLHLGSLDGEECFAQTASEGASAPEGVDFVSLRALYGLLEPGAYALAGRALHVLEWERTAQFCGRCGAPTQAVATERARACVRCQSVVYPRISPAVIGLVERDGKILLARHVRSAKPMYTCLAGFVEPGESLEEAFAREVFEEVGIRVRDVRYFGSQPWAFSHSLMVGFMAQYAAGALQLDPTEIQDARWFGRDDPLPELPGKLSISRALIDAYLANRPG